MPDIGVMLPFMLRRVRPVPTVTGRGMVFDTRPGGCGPAVPNRRLSRRQQEAVGARN